jgi:hypothetical protein
MAVPTEKISLAALNSVGMLAVESVVDTIAPSVIQFVQGLCGELRVASQPRDGVMGLFSVWPGALQEPRLCGMPAICG